MWLTLNVERYKSWEKQKLYKSITMCKNRKYFLSNTIYSSSSLPSQAPCIEGNIPKNSYLQGKRAFFQPFFFPQPQKRQPQPATEGGSFRFPLVLQHTGEKKKRKSCTQLFCNSTPPSLLISISFLSTSPLHTVVKKFHFPLAEVFFQKHLLTS